MASDAFFLLVIFFLKIVDGEFDCLGKLGEPMSEKSTNGTIIRGFFSTEYSWAFSVIVLIELLHIWKSFNMNLFLSWSGC